MSGDYTRLTFDPLKRYSGVLMQQGRVQLDSDWNEEIDILKRRLRSTAFDVFGPVGIPWLASPDAFKIGLIAGPPLDLSIEPGRIYVDGYQLEAFASEAATYLAQPFLPAPPPLPAAGDAVAYLDIWDREVTYIEDPELLDVALGGADTAARMQTVWQLRVEERGAAACGMAVGAPPSAGRLTTQAVAPPAPDDPCILPQASGYRGLENRLYRIEVHASGGLGAARFKWSRDNGAIVSAVRDIAVSGAQATLTVNRIGRDQFMRFVIGDWVTVTDDHRELMGEAGVMAQVLDIDEANRRIVIDRALPAGGRAFGATAGQIGARHTRLQKWNQTAAANPVDGDGLMLTGAGPIAIEDGIEVQFSVNPAGGGFRIGDHWVFWARTATAEIEVLTAAPPRAIEHHYLQLAAITGLGGPAPAVTDCRPPPPQQQAGDCCCTIIVRPGQDIQAGIDALPDAGGCVCLKTGLHIVREPLRIARGNIVLKAESPGTTVRSAGRGPVLVIGNPAGARVEGVDVLGIDFEGNEPAEEPGFAVVLVSAAGRVRVSHCGMSSREGLGFVGLFAFASDHVSVSHCRFRRLVAGIIASTRCEFFAAHGNVVELSARQRSAVAGIAFIESAYPARITDNAISGAQFGILINDDPVQAPRSLAAFSIISGNLVATPAAESAARKYAIDCAADCCAVAHNRIFHGDSLATGIRIAGSGCEVTGNTVNAAGREFRITGPVAIQIGATAREKPIPILGGIVANNVITGLQHGIICADADSLVIEGNVIASSAGRSGFSVMLTRVAASVVSGNRISNALSAISSVSGRRNSFNGNDARAGGAGISVLQETGPDISGNRLDNLDFWGVIAARIAGRLGITANRITSCGLNMGPVGLAVACLAVQGEAHITGNEIIDTGMTGGTQGPSGVDYGIFGDLILEARVSDNLVTYSDVFKRNPSREDRALVMRGFFDFSQGNNELTIGFPVQIHGNKFIGTGLMALVELREAQVNDRTFIRFERVSFDNNYCSHVTPAGVANANMATVWLVGRRAVVMGNHIKSLRRGFASVNFNRMPGPFIGNVTAGGASNHPDFPATEANFNMIA